MCYVVMEGPINTACQVADESPACIPNNESPSQCSVQYNQPPSCWNETICSSATITNGWVNATEYTTSDIGWGRSPNTDPEKYGYTYPAVCSGLNATSTTQIYQTQGCVPADIDTLSGAQGSAVPMWTDDLGMNGDVLYL